MHRVLLVTVVFVIAGGTSITLAQSPPETAAPTPGPDQMVFLGTVPAPPGTTVRLEVLDVPNIQGVTCAAGTTFGAPNGSDSISGFALILEGRCIEGLSQNFRVCWGDDLCDVVVPSFFPPFQPGRTVEFGLLDPSIEISSVLPPVGGPGLGTGLPSAGSDSGQQGPYGWLLWAGVVALGAGLAVGAGSIGVALRRR